MSPRRAPPEEYDDGGGPLYGGIHPQAISVARRFAVSPQTFRDRLASHFKARPGVWLNGLDLARDFGAYAWRTRVSECRTQLGMNIENRIRRVGKVKVSEYRWVP